ncbi:class F sortase [Vallicoccus soli]|uniref:Class F sortase n=1 Tax=Vallicoccus soli TaxID=2339232 RepID=A0A3A3YSV9_9ACTN|nr:class F sortase [Vallicoccus soli]RJK93780.1 class F sortase [Vallicoccus soli]
MRRRSGRVRRRDLAGLAGGAALLVSGLGLWAGSGAQVRADVGALPAPVPSAAPEPVVTATASPRAPAPSRAPRPVRATPFAPPSAAFVPERLVLPAVDVDQPVVPVAAGAGVLDVPEDPDVVGWWRDGARPGSGVGSAVLVGHVDSARYGRGPLARVVDLRPGDRAELGGRRVQGGAGERSYEVVAVRTFVKERLPAERLFTARGPERLVVVTCGGSYDRDRGGWDSNVVVVLEPV